MMQPRSLHRRRDCLRAAGAALLLAAGGPSLSAPPAGPDNPDAIPTWQKLRVALFQQRPIAPAGDWLRLVLPVRAEDAAIVPVAVETRPDSSPAHAIESLYLVIDNNPSPLAAVFRFGPRSGRADLETRVRIDEYTHVRAIAQTRDGQLHMALGYVKASGGCSAPPGKDAQAAQATLGRMRLQVQPPPQPGAAQVAQLMISHPNSSGLAMDQVSRLYAPPHFVRQLTVTLAGEPVLSADLDFAISENPHFRFYVQPHGDAELKAEIVDNEDLKFHTALMLRASGS